METLNEDKIVNENASANPDFLKQSVVFGAITGFALVLLSLLFYAIDLNTASWVQYVSLLVLFAGIVYGTITYRDKQGNGFLSYGRSLGFGVLISLFAGIVLGIYTFLFFQYFDPSQLEQIWKMAEDRMLDQGLTDEQIDQAMGFSKMFMTPIAISVSGIFSMVFWGTVFSLISSIFIKKVDDSFLGTFGQS